jgi:hypothetical protein
MSVATGMSEARSHPATWDEQAHARASSMQGIVPNDDPPKRSDVVKTSRSPVSSLGTKESEGCPRCASSRGAGNARGAGTRNSIGWQKSVGRIERLGCRRPKGLG